MGTSKYVQIADDLDKKMADGQYRVGDTLPAKRALQEIYGAAGGTVNQAVELLVDRGLVEVRQGMGTYVLPRPEPGPSIPERTEALETEVAQLRRRVSELEDQCKAIPELRRDIQQLEALVGEARSNLGLSDLPHHNESAEAAG
ncbi:GntR family transcriptional regulator [Nocardia sp. XZ_19_231]|uniref:GntR family transcriptional regulator n=1 Tax=Nocardia sp. XZ_19_231 TaxID=2769252 RepID=UPI00188DDD5B|nr:GntR family transcriptional regulator [Nocardia sp. XZ_19_231]